MKVAYDIVEVRDADLEYTFEENEFGLIGMACTDISCGDVLTTKSMENFAVIKIYSYKREWATISAGMSCALVVKSLDKEVIFDHQAQELCGQLLYAK